MRVIADGYGRASLDSRKEVRMHVRDMMVFKDDGTLDEILMIRT